jgi:hypothetical protein
MTNSGIQTFTEEASGGEGTAGNRTGWLPRVIPYSERGNACVIHNGLPLPRATRRGSLLTRRIDLIGTFTITHGGVSRCAHLSCPSGLGGSGLAIITGRNFVSADYRETRMCDVQHNAGCRYYRDAMFYRATSS